MIGLLIHAVRAWLGRLSRAWLIAGASALGLVLIFASLGMYRVYDYVQHDNEFCLSCHLMANPFQRFEQSAHRGLGCKACHRPNIIQRSKMGLTQILEMPDSISHHAEVPAERCAECHIKGNPKDWKLIANSVGHRLHLESTDPNLKNIQCLDCHGAGIHEFAPVDRTCAKSGCHENTRIQLGAMSRTTIHCASCHDYTKPVPDSVRGAGLNHQITPRGNDCFSCHAMRERASASIPRDEPHNAVCGTCHNPHQQRTPAEAVKACSAGGCHARVDTISPMHRGLAAGVVQNCTRCHQAHTWRAKAGACTSCHSPDELDDQTGPLAHVAGKPGTMSVVDVALLPVRLSMTLLAQVSGIDAPFKHRVHKAVACSACHETRDGHGVLKVRTITDCNGCHHANRNEKRCTTCHAANRLQPLSRTFRSTLSVTKQPQTRTLTFAHSTHESASCGTCHTNASRMRDVPTCSSCHDDHHTERRSCTTCHTNVIGIKAHTRRVHESCAGAGCHQNTVTTTLRTQRAVCIACHSDKANHQVGGECASCHMIPKPKLNTRAAQ